VTVPSGPVPQPNQRFEQDIAQLRRELEELQRRTLYSAAIGAGGLRIHNGGSITMESAAGVQVLYVGPDSNGVQTFELRRDNGSLVMGLYTNGAQQYWALYDRAGTAWVADDSVTGVGLARPWLPVVLYKLYDSGVTAPYAYGNLPASQITTETILWSGRIPSVTHPRIEIDGVWGQASGANNTTFRLKVQGVTVGTWTQNGTFSVSRKGPYDVTPYINASFASVEVTAIATGTGNVACQVLGCAQRQS
jgi:hypothetical protein